MEKDEEKVEWSNINYIEQEHEYSYFYDLISNFPKGRAHGIMFRGPPGGGKTLLAENLARDFGAEYIPPIDGSPALDRTLIEGNWEILPDGSTYFNPGPLPLAIESANVNGIAFLIINEINAIKENEQISLNGTLSEGKITLMLKSAKTYALNKEAKLIVIGTGNLNVHGINELQESFRDRFPNFWDFDFPTPEKEVEIITKIGCVPKQLAEVIVEFAGHMRKLANLSISQLFSTRQGVNIARTLYNTDAKYLDYTIKSMILFKYSDTKEETETVKQLLDGIDFKSKIKSVLAVIKPVKEAVETISSVKFELAEPIQCFKSFANEYKKTHVIFTGELVSRGFLEGFLAAHVDAAQEYFYDSEMFSLYSTTTGKNPCYGGSLTRAYVIWLYKFYNKYIKALITVTKNIF